MNEVEGFAILDKRLLRKERCRGCPTAGVPPVLVQAVTALPRRAQAAARVPRPAL